MKRKKQKLASVNSKRELVTLQRNFADIIRRPLTSSDDMLADPRSAEMIAPSKKLLPHQRLELYAQQYWWRIEDAFDEDFTTLQSAVPQDHYLKLRDAYLRSCPSESFTLRNLGKRLPTFIKKRSALSSPYTELLYDCARFDWARVEAFDGAELKPLSQQDLSKKDFVRMKLRLQPHVQLLSLAYPVDKNAAQGMTRSMEEASNTSLTRRLRKNRKGRLTFKKDPSFMAVHRHQERIFIKRLSKGEWSVLNRFRKGSSLATLMRSLVGSKDFSNQSLQNAFQEWTTLGWIYVEKNI